MKTTGTKLAFKTINSIFISDRVHCVLVVGFALCFSRDICLTKC